MTAGRGIVHSEMPGPVDTRGLQLWVNLKSDLKMCEPTYQEIEAKDIPSKSENGITVSAYRKPAFQPSAFRRLFIGFQPSAEKKPISMEKG